MVDGEDLDRIERDYASPDGKLTREEVEGDLESADFDETSAEKIGDAIAGRNDLAASQESLRRAQREAIDSISDGGATGQQLVRAEDGFTPIGAPKNVEQRIERSGPTEGKVIGTNRNTGTEGVIGRIELPEDPGV